MGEQAAATDADEGGYPRKRARTRAALLDAARRSIAERGDENTTVALIAEAAGVTPATFYNHFQNKEEVLAAIADELLAAYAEFQARFHEVEQDPAVRVAASIGRIFGAIEADPVLVACMVHLGGQFADRNPDLQRMSLDTYVLGFSSGRFEAEVTPVLREFLSGAIRRCVEAAISGRVGADAGRDVAVLVLQALGLSPADARAAWQTALTAIPA